MGDILTGIVKGLSGFMPQDDPDVRIFNAQTEIRESAEKMEKIYARLGRKVYETDGGEAYPEIKAELDAIATSRKDAEARLQAAKEEKAARERAAAEAASDCCPNCGTQAPAGGKFCQECGSKLMQDTTPQKRFCANCGNEIALGHRFCQECGTKVPE